MKGGEGGFVRNASVGSAGLNMAALREQYASKKVILKPLCGSVPDTLDGPRHDCPGVPVVLVPDSYLCQLYALRVMTPTEPGDDDMPLERLCPRDTL